MKRNQNIQTLITIERNSKIIAVRTVMRNLIEERKQEISIPTAL